MVTRTSDWTTKVAQWFDERTGAKAVWQALFKRRIPKGVNFLYTFGFATLFLFILQAVTGAVLAIYYSPNPDHAYDSVVYITTQVKFGYLLRGLHHWGGNAIVVLVALHGIVVFVLGAYKYPRELTWIVGVLLFGIVMGFAFTGYLLPWDEKAYWATTVGTNIGGAVPFVGDFILTVLRGGSELGVLSLSRFYAFHIALLPAASLGLLGIHLYLVVKHGVSVPPWLWEREEEA